MRDTVNERELLRLICGELEPERSRELERRLVDDAELAARLERLRRCWEGLEPSPSPPPPGFAARVAKAAAAGGEPAGRPMRDRPVLARAAAALALTVGLALGALLGSALEAPGTVTVGIAPETLAESYWAAMDEAGLLDEGDAAAAPGEVPR